MKGFSKYCASLSLSLSLSFVPRCPEYFSDELTSAAATVTLYETSIFRIENFFLKWLFHFYKVKKFLSFLNKISIRFVRY